MNGYGELLKYIQDFLVKDGIVKTINHADIFERDSHNENKFPLINIVPIGITFDENKYKKYVPYK